MSCPVESSRIQPLNAKPLRESGRYILYWMQQSQRAKWNPALEYAVHRANEEDLPLLVAFGLTDAFPEASLRQYTFMLEGLRETQRTLRARAIGCVIRYGDPPEVALALGRRAALIVADRGYLRVQKDWRAQVAREASCLVVQVEGDVVVPVETVADKAEVGARTLRSKIWRQADAFRSQLRETCLRRDSLHLNLPSLDLDDVSNVCAGLRLDRSVAAVSEYFRGGTDEAQKRFRRFCESRLPAYEDYRNHPESDHVSHLSAYLHFGQISPVWLLRTAQKASGAGERNVASYVEELLVRRELATNFVHYTPHYDSYQALPTWARATLAAHAHDEREYLYTRQQLENAETHDPWWNAAMTEMCLTGYLHNHLRMYWGKQILAWSATPEEAHATALALNNRYFLDGRDPNSFANVGWLFGLHDRPWPERHVFGQIRCMTAGGLERKCNIKAYRDKVERLTGSGSGFLL